MSWTWLGCIFQDGRRYFSRREITAMVGGPGNMAIYRHILVISPTAKVLPPKNEQPPTAKTLPPKKYRHLLVYRFRQKSTANSRYRQNVPPTLSTAKEYRQLSISPKRYRQHWIPPTLAIARKVPPILDTAEKVPRTLDTAQKVPGFLFVFVRCSLFFLVLRVPFR